MKPAKRSEPVKPLPIPTTEQALAIAREVARFNPHEEVPYELALVAVDLGRYVENMAGVLRAAHTLCGERLRQGGGRKTAASKALLVNLVDELAAAMLKAEEFRATPPKVSP